jgi:hypothetical protein
MLKFILTSEEAQIIVDELQTAIRARKLAQPVYCLELQAIADKILKASHKRKQFR